MSSARQPHFVLLLVGAWLLIVAQLLAQHWSATAHAFTDSDDAMRLVELRDWIGGQSWFDLRQYRIASDYETHWSRLIDVGLAGTLWVFALFAAPATAERLMFAAWPLLWLLPAMAAIAAVAWRIAGREAALVALLMAVIGLPALHQFRPGRIDHHNVQMALCFVVLAATVWSDRVRWAAVIAGAVSGLALGIGLESLPYLMLCGAGFALRYVFDPKGADAAARYGLALALSSLATFAATVAPDHWTRAYCDAFAINWLALVVVGGLGLALAARYAGTRLSLRLGCALAVGAAAAALALSFDPRCAGGPYKVIDPAAWPIWLAHVHENKSFLETLAARPLTAIAVGAFPALACIAAAVLMSKPQSRRDFGFAVAAAALVVATIMTIEAIRSAMYATWLGIPLVAAFAVHLCAALNLRRLVPRVAVGVMLAPAALSLGAVTIANAAGIGVGEFDRPASDACFEKQSYAPLARMPAGVIAADVNYGPSILALTPHSVLAAPYHRLAPAIVAAHRALAAPPEDARALLRQLGTGYVLICGKHEPNGLDQAELDASLWGHLTAGVVPAWLERVPLGDAQPISVYRVRS